jgi:poly(3-hydroxybutyrate) depolymerase
MRPRPIKPFADYANPFRNGMAENMGTIELIAYTYDALQAWGAENGCPKRPDQTPTEYVQDIARHDSHLAGDARQVAQLYLRAAFSTSPPSLDSHKQLKKAWNTLQAAGSVSA